MIKNLSNRNQNFLILGLLITFIFIRSLNFSEYLNFSADQGFFSLKSLQILTERKLTLLGPTTSLNLNGREIFQGSAIYYFQLFFLILGGFDPVRASYLFMLFASASIIPLFYGFKYLLGQKVAIFASIIYTLLPLYIDYSRFLWNPNYQLALSPYLIWLLGVYKKNENNNLLFSSGLLSGVLLPFHYMFTWVIIGQIIYFYISFIDKFKVLSIFIIGLIIGLSPMIIFELRNDFYNFRTILLFVQNIEVLKSNQSINLLNNPHYFLSLSLFLLLIFCFILKKYISNRLNFLTFVFLFLISLYFYFPKPKHAFGMVNDWNYLQEEKVYNIIKAQNLTSFNIVNLRYNTLSWVQKYLLAKDNINIDQDNYKTNKYLFVVNDNDKYMQNPAYEVKQFTPSKQLKKWQINNTYNLYLLEKITLKN